MREKQQVNDLSITYGYDVSRDIGKSKCLNINWFYASILFRPNVKVMGRWAKLSNMGILLLQFCLILGVLRLIQNKQGTGSASGTICKPRWLRRSHYLNFQLESCWCKVCQHDYK